MAAIRQGRHVVAAGQGLLAPAKKRRITEMRCHMGCGGVVHMQPICNDPCGHRCMDYIVAAGQPWRLRAAVAVCASAQRMLMRSGSDCTASDGEKPVHAWRIIIRAFRAERSEARMHLGHEPACQGAGGRLLWPEAAVIVPKRALRPDLDGYITASHGRDLLGESLRDRQAVANDESVGVRITGTSRARHRSARSASIVPV